MTRENLYVDWAGELVDFILDRIYDPYLATNRDYIAEHLAKKLEDDLKDCIVHEWFCSDCDYRRRYDQ